MEMTLDGDDVEFTIGDSDEEYTINMVQGTFVHMHPYSIGPHIRTNPDPVRWGFFSMAALNTGTDYVTWDNFMLTSVPDVPDADLDTDGDYDGNDFLLGQQQGNPGSFLADWNAQYGTAPLSGVSAVPEPESVALIAMLFPLLGGFMRPSSRGA